MEKITANVPVQIRRGALSKVETTAEEEEASDAFERFSAESDKDKSVKNKSLQHKINTKVSQRHAITLPMRYRLSARRDLHTRG